MIPWRKGEGGCIAGRRLGMMFMGNNTGNRCSEGGGRKVLVKGLVVGGRKGAGDQGEEKGMDYHGGARSLFWIRAGGKGG